MKNVAKRRLARDIQQASTAFDNIFHRPLIKKKCPSQLSRIVQEQTVVRQRLVKNAKKFKEMFGQ